jgi:formylglycine-generating enzyme
MARVGAVVLMVGLLIAAVGTAQFSAAVYFRDEPFSPFGHLLDLGSRLFVEGGLLWLSWVVGIAIMAVGSLTAVAGLAWCGYPNQPNRSNPSLEQEASSVRRIGTIILLVGLQIVLLGAFLLDRLDTHARLPPLAWLTGSAMTAVGAVIRMVTRADPRKRARPKVVLYWIAPGALLASIYWLMVEHDLKMQLCWVPPGTFMMGSPVGEAERNADEDQVEVTLSHGFWLGKFEVTQRQWENLMGTTLRQQSGGGASRFRIFSDSKVYGEGGNSPMYYVNYHEALAFCAKLTNHERRAGRLSADWEYTLPTEAQWEYACRAGTTTATAFGDQLSSREANFNGTHPYNGASEARNLKRATIVGSYAANAWGLCDMHGNVAEWCRDSYDSKLPGGSDPEVIRDPLKQRLVRGGSWITTGGGCRSAHRGTIFGSSWPDSKNYYTGFRVALVRSHAALD